MYIVDVWWNKAAENQCIDRVYRFGQTKQVDVVKIVIAESVEMKILQLQNQKQDLANSVLNKEYQTSLGRLSFSQFKTLFSRDTANALNDGPVNKNLI